MSQPIEQIVEQMREAAEACLNEAAQSFAGTGGRVRAISVQAANFLAVLSAFKEAQERADHWKANHDEMVQRNAVLRERPDLPADRLSSIARYEAEASALRAERDALTARLEASEAEQARLIADLDGAKDAATVAYKEEIARLTSERDALATKYTKVCCSNGDEARAGTPDANECCGRFVDAIELLRKTQDERDAIAAERDEAWHIVRNKQMDETELSDRIGNLTARCDGLAAALKGAEEALSGFLHDPSQDALAEALWGDMDDNEAAYITVKWGHCRNARTALASIKAALTPPSRTADPAAP